MAKITIIVRGGVIQGIQDIPSNVTIEVHDYDVEPDDIDPDYRGVDEDGHPYFLGTWEGKDAPGDADYRDAANAIHHDEGLMEIDPDAAVSRTEGEPGAYVQAWVWVDDNGLLTPIEED